MKKIFVGGAGGFIGGYLVKHLLSQGHQIVAVDIKPFEEWFQRFDEAENHSANLELLEACMELTQGCDQIYNLACNMGGMGFIENNRALCMLSVLINTHLLMAARENKIIDYLYASSACIYPAYRQGETNVIPLKESDALPAEPEEGYGWEKLFSEQICRYFREDFGIKTQVFRFHNVYGPNGTWDGGREKAPAALCRKIINAKLSGNLEIEIWGDGEQTRSFMYIDDCITGLDLLTDSDYADPLNLGTSELVTINQLVDIIENIAEVKVKRSYNLEAPQGVRGRNSDNTEINNILGWEPSIDLKTGLKITYDWIYKEIKSGRDSL